MIHTYPSIAELATSLGKRVIHAAGESIRAGIPFHIALSGGSTPRALFEKMAAASVDPGFWEGIHFFWVDERCVPPDHPESNFRMTDEGLFRPLSIPYDKIYRMRGEDDPKAETDRYEGLIRSVVPSRDGLPCFDLILLGMGTDGHTASIFPDQMKIMHSVRICENARHPESGQQRITLTGPVINNAERICFMISGKNKAAVLSSVLTGKRGAEHYPVAHIKPASGTLDWYLDDEAASCL